ncbi:hypothetical protein, partial [Selenomonas bovis]|uniref:hypothetical protein n=1 Tax=Selenomonas bovis TaxID=416586 RepID=UPI003AB92B39
IHRVSSIPFILSPAAAISCGIRTFSLHSYHKTSLSRLQPVAAAKENPLLPGRTPRYLTASQCDVILFYK